ncbi:hypothetical protein DNTS_008903 [Danionella cerebrum]|uniref:Peptidase M14 domain-containing protein n=1 Tax=Danionella cerebrum TaxID=2873325 RepID=A0A553MVV5_9TELE|nr:hypothetical protein DNTS_008903 [Danionella translucida]
MYTTLRLILLQVLILAFQRLGSGRAGELNEETYDAYYSYDQMTDRLQRFSHKYSHICSLQSIGQSVEGRELWVMRITSNPNTDLPGKPRFKYVGNVHGDEALSRQVLLYLIDFLLTRYELDVRVSELVNKTDIYVMASLNPDGFERAREGDCTGTTEARDNAKHHDLEMSFRERPEESEDEVPEVPALLRWIHERKFVLSGSLHAGSVSVSYPFDHGRSDGNSILAADDALFHFLAQTFRENHPVMRMNDPGCLENPDKSSEDGTMQDYNYLKGNCFEVTFDLSCCKYPAASQLYAEWTNNKEALIAYMMKAHIGVRGFVVTKAGLGLHDATISVSGIDHNITTWVFGDYYRLLLPGRYDITASLPGYLSNTVNNVPVFDGKATLLNFTLEEPMEEELLLEPPDHVTITEEAPDTPPAASPVSNLDFIHHDYNEMEILLRLLNTVYPSITRLSSAGQSLQGRNLYVMEISSNPDVEQQGKPEVMLLGNLHGNEFIGREFLLNLIEYLCRFYGKDPLVTRLVNSTRIHIMPSMNPDGYELAMKAHKEQLAGDMSIFGHSNGHLVDLNTNFPDESGGMDFVEVETQAVINWIKGHFFVLSASIRGGFRGVVYPSVVDSVDEDLFKSIAEGFYKESKAFQEPQPCDVPRIKQKRVLNHRRPEPRGADLLTWVYQGMDTLMLNIGLSCELVPPEEALSEYWESNHDALLKFIQQVHLFVQGMVTDALTGKGIANATVTVEGSRHRVHTSSTGQYWRPLAPGSYHITASATGYSPMSVTVRVLDTRVEQVDFRLSRESVQLSPEEVEQKDFEKLVELLLGPGELDQLVHSLLPAQTLLYRTYRERSEFLRGLTLNFPHITRLHSLGQSSEFRTIWALEIAGNLDTPEPSEPKIRFVAGVHGNAAVGPELLLEFASVLCINYGRHPAITKASFTRSILPLLIGRSSILIVPSVNPDGRELAYEGICSSIVGYTNAHGIDLDTDFFSGNESVQPETRAMIDLISEPGFSLSVVLDGGFLLATYPYDKPDEHAPNEETLRYLASMYAISHPFMHVGNVACSENSEDVPGGILKGAEFSPHTGSMKDLSLDVGGCPEITVYTGCCVFPPEAELHSLWMEHRLPLFRMLLEIHRGLSGDVRDTKGRPVAGAVLVLNGSLRVPTDRQGHFRALLAPGTHHLQVQARGYQQELQQVNVFSDRVTSPMVIDFTADRARVSQAVLIIATASLIGIFICALLACHLRTSKFSRIRDGMRWLRRKRDDLRMEAMPSEKSPLRQELLEESESEDEPFFVERRLAEV